MIAKAFTFTKEHIKLRYWAFYGIVLLSIAVFADIDFWMILASSSILLFFVAIPFPKIAFPFRNVSRKILLSSLFSIFMMSAIFSPTEPQNAALDTEKQFDVTELTVQPTEALSITVSIAPTLPKSPTPTKTLTPIVVEYKVSRVIDGDTIELSDGSRVRYIGIDTPEVNECYASQATAANKKLVLGKNVGLKKDVSETDRYGRLLRYVYVGTTFVNERLVKDGYAKASSYPPDIAKQTIFRDAELFARDNQLGLWGSVCNDPTKVPYVQPKPTENQDAGGTGFACNCSKTCKNISSCEEAYYLLNTCGCSARDGDGDGIPCESGPC